MSRHYLLLYNLLSLLAWTYLTARVASHSIATTTPPGDEKAPLLLLLRTDISFVTAVQSVAALEILHAATGLVRASPGAAAVQIGGRNLVVWTVMRRFPDLVVAPGLGRVALLGCLGAWGCSDVLRYAFFVAVALGRGPPKTLKWLRYSAFILLYPVGFLSEASLVYLSLVQAGGIGLLYRGYLFVGLLSYIPASYFLYTYMFSQRRRALGLTGRVKDT